MPINFPNTRRKVLERVYCISIFLCIIVYNIFLDSDWIEYQDGVRIVSIFIFSITYVFSFVIVAVRIVSRVTSSREVLHIECHIIYITFITAVVVFQWELDYGKRFAQSLYVTKNGSECRNSIQKTPGIDICYSYAAYPRIQLIIIDPNRELSQPRGEWRHSTIKYFLDRGYPINAVVQCKQPTVNHFYGDVFYLKTFCE